MGHPAPPVFLLWPDHLGVISLQHACCSGKGKLPSQHPGTYLVPTRIQMPGGLLEPSPGGRVTAGDTTILMVRGRGVTTSHHCTQDPHECRKSTVTNPIPMKKKYVSRNKSVSTFHQNNTASVGFAPGPSLTACILRWHKVSHPRP